MTEKPCRDRDLERETETKRERVGGGGVEERDVQEEIRHKKIKKVKIT